MKNIAVFLALIMSFMLTGCGSGSDDVTVSGITISGSSSVAVGSTVQLTALVSYSDGSSDNAAVTWSSSNSAVAEVSSSGIVTGISSGAVVISAKKDDKSAIFLLTVSGQTATATASAISLSGSSSLNVGASITLSAVVTYSDGSSDSSGISWSSSNSSIATVSSSGKVTGVAAGSVTITAASGGVSKSKTLTVNSSSKTVSSIAISGSSSVNVQSSVLLNATVTYSDGSTGSSVSWSSSNASVATVSSAGLVTGVAAGSVTITATSGSVSKTKTLTVSGGTSSKTVSSISITGSSSVEEQSSALLSASVSYSDGSSDSSVSWSSSNESVATVSSAGLVTGVAAGSATISATSGGVTKTFSLTVTELVVEDGISLYIQEGYADTIWAWIRTSKDTPVFSDYIWPGAPLDELVDTETDSYKVTKKNDVYKILFKGQESVWYVLHKGSPLFGDTEMTQTTYFTADGTKSTTDPFDYRPQVTITPNGGEQKGERVITLTVAGENISSQKALFNDTELTIPADGVLSFALSDYLAQGESGSFTLVASNSEGTKTASAEFTRNDNKQVEVVDAYGTLEPFAEEAIYFVMTDRFVNGNSGNDYRDQGTSAGQGTWDIAIGSANIGYMGGDFEGIYNNADYIAGMGFGAVWITPIVDNPDESFTGGTPCQEGSSPGADGGKTGYHGYWADNFYAVDEHLESDGFSFSEYTDKMRAKGLKTVLDIVLNHANPAFTMTDEQYSRSKFGKLYDESGALVAESGNVANGHEWFEGNDQLAQLADFNPGSDAVFEYLSDAQLKWINEGADAFRIDTIKHMPIEFWKKFTDKMRLTKPDMYMFGEHFDISSAGISNYQINAGMDALDFPGKYAMQNVFGGGGGYDALLGYLHLEDGVIHSPYTAATFYDNHDMARMSATDNGFIDAHNWLFTTRGVPVLYYGSEMGFQRGKGEHTGNRNYFGEANVSAAKSSPIYEELVKINNIRKENPALQRGLQINLDISGDQASFLRVYQYEDTTQTALVLLNKADSASSFSVSQYITPGEWVDAETGDTIDVTVGIDTEVKAHGFKVFLFNSPVEDDALITKLSGLMEYFSAI